MCQAFLFPTLLINSWSMAVMMLDLVLCLLGLEYYMWHKLMSSIKPMPQVFSRLYFLIQIKVINLWLILTKFKKEMLHPHFINPQVKVDIQSHLDWDVWFTHIYWQIIDQIQLASFHEKAIKMFLLQYILKRTLWILQYHFGKHFSHLVMPQLDS